MKVSVVCPFFNEQLVIVQSVTRMIDTLSKQFDEWELIVINDGSQDESLSLLLNSNCIKNKNLRILSCSINQGRGRALKNGINAFHPA